uniref:Uncharacterized protein LOC111126011 isoform X2 n=1 Tax=Crassostrea virginica TaxID=6565 RepID=A0A8B8DEU4_CRAVI|nr:uncharacterized protein LOC111126011 isoform X2 [Crassostrea virginica]
MPGEQGQSETEVVYSAFQAKHMTKQIEKNSHDMRSNMLHVFLLAVQIFSLDAYSKYSHNNGWDDTDQNNLDKDGKGDLDRNNTDKDGKGDLDKNNTGRDGKSDPDKNGNNTTEMKENKMKTQIGGQVFMGLFVLSLCVFLLILIIYIMCVHEKKDHSHINYVALDAEMLSHLEKNYASDDLSSGSSKSIGWNNLFVEYDCCAVHEVLGTTNDFDNTPWCTTSGSCQATSSQIPRTCCKDVTKDNYKSAPSACHASVIPGTFKQSCISRMKSLSTVNIDDSTLTIFSNSIFLFMVCQLLAAFLCFCLYLHHRHASNQIEDSRKTS